jgi:two-component system, NarL family, nitrate/nitrite response regulator NarL
MAADTMARAVERASGFTVIGRCNNRGEVATACATTPPDLAVLDVGLYEHDARFAINSVRRSASATRILLMSPDLDTEQLAIALMAGADNCISAYVDVRDFLAAIRATAARRSILTPAMQRDAVRRVIELGRTDGQRLSPRERDVLRLAATGLHVDDIARQLFISPNTARTHLHRSYRKLGATNRTGALATAMRRGLLR